MIFSDILYNFFMFICITTTGVATSAWIITLFNQPTLCIEDNVKASDNYIDEYSEEFELLEDRELDENYIKSLFDKTILEKTPKGDILMMYNSHDKAFCYYFNGIPGCPTAPFNYLDTVAKAYCLKYDCKQLFIKKQLANKKIENKPDEDSIYAKFKQNNVATKSHISNHFVCRGKIKNTEDSFDNNTNKIIEKDFCDIDFATFKNKRA